MTLAIQSPPVPLHVDDEGVARVAGTRVTLDTIVQAFQQGATAEEIAQQYSSVSLAEVYSVISFYLARRSEVDEYLRERAVTAGRVRSENESRFPSNGIRERLLSRQSGGI